MNDKASNMVIAMQGWGENLSVSTAPPQGLFGQEVKIQTSGGVHISNAELDFEFDVPFDDDLTPNEAEIVVYNLSQSTISRLAYNDTITVEAGYAGDTGVIFSGRISKVKTKFVNADKQTTIYAIDCQSLQDQTLASVTYKADTQASYILKDLIGRFHVPVAVFNPRRDYNYKDETTVEGSLMEAVQKYSEVCGVSTYFCKGKIYSRWLKDGDNINFTVCPDTGLLDSPEEFEEELTYEDSKETVTGYKLKMLLQHRITTAAIINLQSRNCSGQFRVRSGTHSYDGTNFYTEMEVIA